MKRSPIRRPGTTTWHWRFLMVTWLAVAVLGAPTRRGRDHTTGSSAKQVCFCPLFGNNYDSVRSLLSRNIYLMFMTLYHDIGKSYLCCRNNSENPFTCTPNANQLSWFLPMNVFPKWCSNLWIATLFAFPGIFQTEWIRTGNYFTWPGWGRDSSINIMDDDQVLHFPYDMICLEFLCMLHFLSAPEMTN